MAFSVVVLVRLGGIERRRWVGLGSLLVVDRNVEFNLWMHFDSVSVSMTSMILFQ